MIKKIVYLACIILLVLFFMGMHDTGAQYGDYSNNIFSYYTIEGGYTEATSWGSKGSTAWIGLGSTDFSNLGNSGWSSTVSSTLGGFGNNAWGGFESNTWTNSGNTGFDNVGNREWKNTGFSTLSGLGSNVWGSSESINFGILGNRGWNNTGSLTWSGLGNNTWSTGFNRIDFGIQADDHAVAAIDNYGEQLQPNDPLVQRVHQLINEHRTSIGLSALTYNDVIEQQAKKHSEDMASGRVAFSHDGFDNRKEEIGKIISWMGIAENVGYNMGYSDPAGRVVERWLNSLGHKKNIEGNYNLTGIGVVQANHLTYYFTQIFVLSR